MFFLRLFVLQKRLRPTGALLAALWGVKPKPESSGLLVFGSGAYVHRTTVGDLVFDPALPYSSYGGVRENSLPHTVFSSESSLGCVPKTVKVQLDRI